MTIIEFNQATRGVTCVRRRINIQIGSVLILHIGLFSISPSGRVLIPFNCWILGCSSSTKPFYEVEVSYMQQDPALSFLPQLAQRFQLLVWSCLDSDLTRTAVFHAERYHAMDPRNHDARHLYATALLREGQTHSALTLVNLAREVQCSGCLEIQAKCCTALGRHRQAREALEATLNDLALIPTGLVPILHDKAVIFTPPRVASTSSRPARIFPDEAALRCRSGTMALKGNLSEMASSSFRQALALNSQLWEAFEGLCALGMFLLTWKMIRPIMNTQDQFLKLMNSFLLVPHLSNEHRRKKSNLKPFQLLRVLDFSRLIPAMPVIYFVPGNPTLHNLSRFG